MGEQEGVLDGLKIEQIEVFEELPFHFLFKSQLLLHNPDQPLHLFLRNPYVHLDKVLNQPVKLLNWRILEISLKLFRDPVNNRTLLPVLILYLHPQLAQLSKLWVLQMLVLTHDIERLGVYQTYLVQDLAIDVVLNQRPLAARDKLGDPKDPDPHLEPRELGVKDVLHVLGVVLDEEEEDLVDVEFGLGDVVDEGVEVADEGVAGPGVSFVDFEFVVVQHAFAAVGEADPALLGCLAFFNSL